MNSIEKLNYLKSLPPTKHVNNYVEGKLLRKIMSETGMNEAEVRSIKKYRKMLADSCKNELSYFSRIKRQQRRLVKEICKALGLPSYHIDVKNEYKRRINDDTQYWFIRQFYPKI